MAAALQQRARTPLQAGDVLVVIHDFDARSADELTLRKTDQIQLVELDDGFGDGWYLGKHLSQGAMGLFPGVYTAKLPPNFTPVGVPISRSMPPPGKPRTEEKPLPPNPPARPSSDASHRSSISPPLSNFLARNSVTPPVTSHIPGVHRSIGQTLSGKPGGEESPVMNETLSVINEHITDLNTPRQSLAPPQHVMEDSGSEYSSHLELASYITGPETDSEENLRLTVADVKRWDAKETAEYLRGIGVDPKHCAIFEEQEITGDVLLEMDQSFIHMKEFDFGLMGRRLKTWHKIRDFQDQVLNGKDSNQKTTIKQNGSSEEAPRNHTRALSGNTILPRIPSLMEEPGLSLRQSQHTYPHINVGSASPPLDPARSPTSSTRPQLGGSPPPSPWRASVAAESPSRPSAASIRESKHSRRHSSIEFAKHEPQEPQRGSVANLSPPHKKKPSLDRDWSMSNVTTTNAGASTPSLKLNISRQPESVDISTDSAYDGESSNIDLDRGYFSGNELDNRKSRNLLRKRESASHSRHSSLLDETSKPGIGVKRHSRLSSVDSIPIRERRPPVTSPAAKAYHSSSYKARFRSSSAKNLATQRSTIAQSPTVTNLEDDGTSVLSSPKAVSGPASPAATAYAPWSAAQKAIKLLGLRAASDNVTGSEKETASTASITQEPLKDSPVAASPSGSQTPSATSRSFEIDNTDTSSKGTTEHLGPLLHTRTTLRSIPKTKRQTSAYTKGLLQLSPAEARKDCDFHGWMKKRSTGIIAQWKPRLFILRGRRLSYYYSENDTEEKGIIDISGHKVLSATADPITSLQATITGVSSTPSLASTGSSAEVSPNLSRNPGGGAPFYFKLVPPKVGTSRAVQFTRPTVHFFQVDNIVEGRKWMGEILKATIEHDLSSFETTNRQKTITLAKARARKERPPALKGTEEVADEEVAELAEKPTPQEEKDEQESGLNITGLDFSQSDVDLQLRAAPPDEPQAKQEDTVDEEKPKT